MDDGKKTGSWCCRFLSDDYFQRLYEAFIEAFSDYVIPFALTRDQFRNHINLNAVDLERTVGCVENGKLIGFSLNGFGFWDGKLTAYDAGTGVVPARRRQGISRQMFEMMLPVFAQSGIEQFLLEVITTNAAAMALYEGLGFQVVREVALLEREQGMPASGTRGASHVELRNIANPDWDYLTKFWDGKPSWQNTIEAVKRSRANKRIIGAFIADHCVGYIVFSSIFGRVAHLAVHKEHRQQGIGTSLVLAMQGEMADGFSMQVINIDKELRDAMDFFARLGFQEKISQYEMIKSI